MITIQQAKLERDLIFIVKEFKLFVRVCVPEMGLPLARRSLAELSTMNDELCSVSEELRGPISHGLEHLEHGYHEGFNATVPVLDLNTVQQLSWATYASEGDKSFCQCPSAEVFFGISPQSTTNL